MLDIEYQIVALVLVQDNPLIFDDALYQQGQFVLELFRRQTLQTLQIDPVQNGLVHALLEFLIGRRRQARCTRRTRMLARFIHHAQTFT